MKYSGRAGPAPDGGGRILSSEVLPINISDYIAVQL
jgi:hypothetical protein